jgi:hypothetical protein
MDMKEINEAASPFIFNADNEHYVN